jgi:hypothetical protein
MGGRASRWVWGVGLLLVGLIWFRFAPIPFAGPGLATGVFLAILARDPGPAGRKALLVNLSVVAFALTGIEAYFWYVIQLAPREQVNYPTGYEQRDEIMGYVPTKNATARVQAFYRGAMIYDVEYTIDSTGHRIAPPAGPVSPPACILFFGDSYTFGEGVPDTAALPYRLGIRTAGRYRVYNFAFHGYGPQQMLSALLSGRVKEGLTCEPRFAIYSMVPDHVARVSGLVPWGRHGPRYRLGDDQTVRLDGHFDDERPVAIPSWKTYLLYQTRKSALVQQIEKPRLRPEHMALFLAVINRAVKEIKGRFPACQFDLILWPHPYGELQALHDAVRDSLRARGIRVHEIEDVIPGYRSHPENYRIDPHDRHPNARADELVAAYLADSVLQLPAPTP